MALDSRLTAIYRYPVKSLHGESLRQCEVALDGIPGDRATRLLIEAGHARVGKSYRGKEDSRLHLLAEPQAAIAQAQRHGVRVSLDSTDAHAFDEAPISLIFDTWLAEMQPYVGYIPQVERFRPNFFAIASPTFTQRERDLVGRTLLVGDVELDVLKPIERCVVVTYDPSGGPSDPYILRALAQERHAEIGIYCTVRKVGTVRAGARVALLDA